MPKPKVILLPFRSFENLGHANAGALFPKVATPASEMIDTPYLSKSSNICGEPNQCLFCRSLDSLDQVTENAKQSLKKRTAQTNFMQ